MEIFMEKIKVGILGTGRGIDIALGIRYTKDAVISAVCDRNEVRLEKWKNEFPKRGVEGFACFTEYEEMLKSDIDAVIIASEPHNHAEQAIMALEAGKHVLSEIPTIYTVEDARRLKAAVKAHPELKYMVGENACYWEYIKTWKKMREDGKFGTIIYAEAEYLHCSTPIDQIKPPKDPNYWRRHLPAIRYLTHSLGPLLYVMDDEVTKVSCYVPEFEYNKYNKEKSVGVALFQTKKGAVIRIFICFGAYVEFDHNFALYGSNGMIMTDKTEKFYDKNCFARFADIPTRVDEMIEIPVGVDICRNRNANDHGGADPKMVADFIKCIVEDTKPELDVDAGIKMSLPGIIAEQSYKNGNASLEIPEI